MGGWRHPGPVPATERTWIFFQAPEYEGFGKVTHVKTLYGNWVIYLEDVALCSEPPVQMDRLSIEAEDVRATIIHPAALTGALAHSSPAVREAALRAIGDPRIHLAPWD